MHITRKILQMVENITDVVPSETSDNDTSITMEGLIISSDLEGTDKTRNENKEKLLPDELALFAPFIVFAIVDIRNIKGEGPALMPYIGTFQKLGPLM